MKTTRSKRGLTPAIAIELALPVVVVSESNRRDHWAAKHRRISKQQNDVILGLKLLDENGRGLTPCQVILSRQGGKPMDGDNLQSAFKVVRDAVAAWLGVDDGDPRIVWEYRQDATPPESRRPAGIRIRVERKL